MAEKHAKRKPAAILSADVGRISTQFTIEAGLEAEAELPERSL